MKIRYLVKQSMMVIITLLMAGSVYSAPMTPADLHRQSEAAHKIEDSAADYYKLEEKLKETARILSEEDEAKEEKEEIREEKPAEDKRTLAVKEVTTDPSKILSPAEIEEITSSISGKTITIDEIFKAVKRINRLYAEKGYPTAKAFLPPQKVEDGKLLIRLVEGRVGDIILKGKKYTRSSYILKRLSDKKGDIISLKRLENDLRLFNTSNEVFIRSELAAGKEFGTTDLVIDVKEPRRYQGILFLDNMGRESIGEERLGLRLKSAALLGFSDPLNLGITYGENSLAWHVDYGFSAGRRGTRLTLNYDNSEIDVNSGDFENINLEGNSDDAGLEISHPFIVKHGFNLTGTSGYHMKNSISSATGKDLFEVDTQTISLGFNTETIGRSKVCYTSFNIISGSYETKMFNASNAVEKDDFLRYNGSVTYLQRINEALFASIRFNAQYSDYDNLPSSEQYQIGGMSSVRGYSEGILMGDSGYFLSSELNFSLPFRGKTAFLKKKIKGLVFLDHGGAFPYKGNNEKIGSDDFITGTGFGLLFNFSKYFTGRFNLGVPVTKQDGESSMRANFYIQSQFY